MREFSCPACSAVHPFEQFILRKPLRTDTYRCPSCSAVLLIEPLPWTVFAMSWIWLVALISILVFRIWPIPLMVMVLSAMIAPNGKWLMKGFVVQGPNQYSLGQLVWFVVFIGAVMAFHITGNATPLVALCSGHQLYSTYKYFRPQSVVKQNS
jgi:hypothetical protein